MEDLPRPDAVRAISMASGRHHGRRQSPAGVGGGASRSHLALGVRSGQCTAQHEAPSRGLFSWDVVVRQGRTDCDTG